MDRNKLKLLIEMSSTVEEANRYIEEYGAYKAIETKAAFLDGLFSVNILSRHIPKGQEEKDILSDDYYAALSHIINRRLRG